MKTIKNTIAEYKAPKCKVVTLCMNSSVMQPLTGSNNTNIDDWEYDDETL